MCCRPLIFSTDGVIDVDSGAAVFFVSYVVIAGWTLLQVLSRGWPLSHRHTVGFTHLTYWNLIPMHAAYWKVDAASGPVEGFVRLRIDGEGRIRWGGEGKVGGGGEAGSALDAALGPLERMSAASLHPEFSRSITGRGPLDQTQDPIS
jgi:hypothetical protein